MTLGTLLVVAPIAQHYIEVFETATELGWTPVSVQSETKVSDFPWKVLPVEEVSKKLWRGHVFVGSISIPVLPRGTRIDRAWRAYSANALEIAERNGAEDFVSLIHPSAHVSPSAGVGRNVFVGPGVTVSSETTIGDFCRIGRGSTIGHHVVLGQSVSIGPGVTIPGNVKISDGVTVGPGATFINGIEVGTDSLIAAGSVVTRRVLEGSLVMGNPARRPRNPIRTARRNVKRWRGRLLKKLGLYSAIRQFYRRLRP
jgi:UDP-3-O-[3-hydroxymyristoyl] glucosamine N-acyltransferase